MVWTNAKFDRHDTAALPAPPTWLTWAAYKHDNIERTYEYVEVQGTDLHGKPYTIRQRQLVTETGPEQDQWQGKIRHHHDLFTARKHVGYSDHENKFWADWRIYEWVDGAYVLRHEGTCGQPKDEHPLFAQKMTNPNAKKRKTKKQLEREKREAEEAEVLASIQRDMAKTGT